MVLLDWHERTATISNSRFEEKDCTEISSDRYLISHSHSISFSILFPISSSSSIYLRKMFSFLVVIQTLLSATQPRPAQDVMEKCREIQAELGN
jgi:hypothetical protein